MNILVTGGAGFIGSNFLHYEKKHHPEDRLICFDLLTYAANPDSVKDLKGEGFRFVKGDIADREAVFSVFDEEKPDIVVNFAAESHVDRSIEDPEIFVRTNICGTTTLMDACVKFGTGRFHQISTDEVYGDLPLERPDLFFTEDTPVHTSSPYSSSKASADLFVMAYNRTYGLNTSISRCSNNYGPYQHPEKLIPKALTNALTDKKIPVYGDGLNVRDWLYVEDHCRAVDIIMRQAPSGSIYNVGGHNEIANIDLVKTLLRVLGKDESLIEFVKDRPGHDRRYAIDPSKIERELSWTPATDVESGLLKTVSWYTGNPGWWGGLI